MKMSSASLTRRKTGTKTRSIPSRLRTRSKATSLDSLTSRTTSFRFWDQANQTRTTLKSTNSSASIPLSTSRLLIGPTLDSNSTVTWMGSTNGESSTTLVQNQCWRTTLSRLQIPGSTCVPRKKKTWDGGRDDRVGLEEAVRQKQTVPVPSLLACPMTQIAQSAVRRATFKKKTCSLEPSSWNVQNARTCGKRNTTWIPKPAD